MKLIQTRHNTRFKKIIIIVVSTLIGVDVVNVFFPGVLLLLLLLNHSTFIFVVILLIDNSVFFVIYFASTKANDIFKYNLNLSTSYNNTINDDFVTHDTNKKIIPPIKSSKCSKKNNCNRCLLIIIINSKYNTNIKNNNHNAKSFKKYIYHTDNGLVFAIITIVSIKELFSSVLVCHSSIINHKIPFNNYLFPLLCLVLNHFNLPLHLVYKIILTLQQQQQEQQLKIKNQTPSQAIVKIAKLLISNIISIIISVFRVGESDETTLATKNQLTILIEILSNIEYYFSNFINSSWYNNYNNPVTWVEHIYLMLPLLHWIKNSNLFIYLILRNYFIIRLRYLLLFSTNLLLILCNNFKCLVLTEAALYAQQLWQQIHRLTVNYHYVSFAIIEAQKLCCDYIYGCAHSLCTKKTMAMKKSISIFLL